MNEASNAKREVRLDDQNGVQAVVAQAILGLWDVVNNLTRLRPTHRENYRVTIFGSARAKPDTFVYDEVKRIASTLAQMDCDIIRRSFDNITIDGSRNHIRPKRLDATVQVTIAR